MNPKGQIAIITGAGSGIGRATTIELVNNGWTVVLAGRRLETLEETIDRAGSSDGHTLAVVTDVSEAESVEALFEKTVAEFGRVDLVFNNAGINVPVVPIEELSPQQWKSIVDVNLTGAFLCTRQAFRFMSQQRPMGGRIINNGSTSAASPRPNSAPYTATKHAMTGLTKSTALDGRKYDIACGQINIGNAETQMVTKVKTGVPQADGSLNVEPTFDVRHVAEAVLHMANLPLDANILFMTVMATKMPFVGRG